MNDPSSEPTEESNRCPESGPRPERWTGNGADAGGASGVRLADRLKTVGTVLAGLLSIIALGHSVWTDSRSRECDYLYSKHSRLGTLVEELRRLAAPYDELFAETKLRVEAEEVPENEMASLAAQLVSERIMLADQFDRKFEVSRDLFDGQALVEVDGDLAELREYANSLDLEHLPIFRHDHPRLQTPVPEQAKTTR